MESEAETEAETEGDVYDRIIQGALAEWQGKENEQSPHFDEGLAKNLVSLNSGGIQRPSTCSRIGPLGK